MQVCKFASLQVCPIDSSDKKEMIPVEISKEELYMLQNPSATGFKVTFLAALNPMLAAEFRPNLTYSNSRVSGEVIPLTVEETETFF